MGFRIGGGGASSGSEGPGSVFVTNSFFFEGDGGGFTSRQQLRSEGSDCALNAHPTLGLATAPNVSEVPSLLQQRRQGRRLHSQPQPEQ